MKQVRLVRCVLCLALAFTLSVTLIGCGKTLPASAVYGYEDDARPALDPEKPMIALTFDDGPSIHTPRLLDLFAEYGGRGTFCVIGNRIDLLPDTVARTAREGHELAVHSWDHCQLTRLGKKQMQEEIETTREKIFGLTGDDCTVIRPTYGAVNDTLKRVAKDLDMIIVNWSVDTLDWKTRDPDGIYQRIMDGAENGAIILCHDLHGTTVDAMERVIPDLVAAGYQLVTVTELLTAGERTVEAGTLYRRQGPKPEASE